MDIGSYESQTGKQIEIYLSVGPGQTPLTALHVGTQIVPGIQTHCSGKTIWKILVQKHEVSVLKKIRLFRACRCRVLVPYPGSRSCHNAPTALAHANSPVGIFVIHKEAFVQESNLSDGFTPYQ